MGDLLDRCVKGIGETFQIVPHLFRCGLKASIGHQRGSGKVVGQPDFRDTPRLVALEMRQIEGGFEQLVLGQQRDLMQQLKALRRPVCLA